MSGVHYLDYTETRLKLIILYLDNFRGRDFPTFLIKTKTFYYDYESLIEQNETA